MHDVFHVSSLKKYVPNPRYILDLDDNILVNQRRSFEMEPEQILETREKQLRNQVLQDVEGLPTWGRFLGRLESLNCSISIPPDLLTF